MKKKLRPLSRFELVLTQKAIVKKIIIGGKTAKSINFYT